MMARHALPAVLFAALPTVLACDPQPPEGEFECSAAEQCPTGWTCDMRGGTPVGHCYRRVASTMDASATPDKTGGSMVFLPEGDPAYACGAWQPVRATDAPPAYAVAYGVEYTERGPRGEYLCRFGTQLDGKPVVVQGRAVFGTACLAALPAGQDTAERSRPSAEFEVFVDATFCARVVTYDAGSTRLMQTGVDGAGNKTFSCVAVVASAGLPDPSKYLGRFDPDTERCTFEYKGSTRNVFASDAGPGGAVLVVAIP